MCPFTFKFEHDFMTNRFLQCILGRSDTTNPRYINANVGEVTVGHLGQRVDSYLPCQELAQVLGRQGAWVTNATTPLRWSLFSLSLISSLAREQQERQGESPSNDGGCYLKSNNQ